MRQPNTSLDSSAHKQTIQVCCFRVIVYIQIQQAKHQNTHEVKYKSPDQKLHYIRQTYYFHTYKD